MTTKRTAALAIMLALVTVLAACGSSSSKSDSKTTTTKKTETTKAKAKATTTTAADVAAVTADITKTFNAYLAAPDLNGQLAQVDKGQTLAAVQTKLNAATASAKLPVQVVNVKTTVAADGKTAKFTYDLAGLPSGTVLLPGQSGGAVLQSDGTTWLLDRNTVCDLGSAGAPQYADECLTAASS